MNKTTICPTCGQYGNLASWNGDYECQNCGAEWNGISERKEALKRKRDEWERKTGERPHCASGR